MPSLKVVILTDSAGRSDHLAEAVRTVADCRVVDAWELWASVEAIDGVIVDIPLDRPNVARSLKRLSERTLGFRPAIICLTHGPSSSILREAAHCGATACFPATAEPGTIVGGLCRQIAPGKTMTDLLVERNFARTGMVLADMLGAARSGRIDPATTEEGIDPVLRAIREGDLSRWLDLVQAHDDTTLRHCLLVSGLTAHFATHLGLPAADRQALVRASLVHDVGKARMPLAILNKPSPLTAEEMTVMRTHAAVGHRILLDSGLRDPLVLAVTRHHHEMLDGSGYPDALQAGQIGDHIRLVTICDIYAALTERRPYRRPMPEADALKILRDMSGKLEPALVEAFAASLPSASSGGTAAP